MRSAAMRSFGFASFRFRGKLNHQIENGGQDAQHTGNGEDGVHLTHGELRHGGNGLLCAGAQLVAAVGDHDVEQDDEHITDDDNDLFAQRSLTEDGIHHLHAEVGAHGVDANAGNEHGPDVQILAALHVPLEAADAGDQAQHNICEQNYHHSRAQNGGNEGGDLVQSGLQFFHSTNSFPSAIQIKCKGTKGTPLVPLLRFYFKVFWSVISAGFFPCLQLIQQVAVGISVVGQDLFGRSCKRSQFRAVDLHALLFQSGDQIVGLLLVQLTVVIGRCLCSVGNDLLLVSAQLVPAALGNGKAHAGVDVVGDAQVLLNLEQVVVVDHEIYDEFKKELGRYHVHFCNAEEKKKLEQFMFGATAYSENVNEARLNSIVPGKNATWIAEQAGFKVPDDVQILVCEVKEIGPNEPMTREKLSPVLGMIKANSTEDGIEKAAQTVEFNGLGHSAAIHTTNHEISKAFGKRIKAIRIIENAPSTFGGIGSVYNAFLPSLTLGCGSYGHNSVSNNVSAINLLNIKRIGRRNNNMQWVKLPPKIYFERNSIRYLRDMKEMKKAMIVTDRGMYDLGYVGKIEDVIRRRRNKVDVDLFIDVEPDPSLDMTLKGLEIMKSFQPDTIIAIGGGSSMDAAKVMWLMYEHPEVNFDDIKQKFMDIRKRAFKFPELGKKAKLVCIPTTSGTGSEVTPFAVITDTKENKKYPLTDYALTPTIAIVDPEFAMSMPPRIAADTGIDVLTHAIEAYVSILASDFTDGWAKQAVKLVFENLEKSVLEGDPDARIKMHNAASIAGMAFANAFLGMNHSLAHKIGGEWHIPHGRTNGMLLPHVIRYNGTVPTKLNIWPKIEDYKADKKYRELAELIGLHPKTDAEGVEMFAQAVEKLWVKVGGAVNVKSQNISKADWEESVHRIAMNAYEDQCTPANPRMPMVKDMEAILETIYDYESPFAKK